MKNKEIDAVDFLNMLYDTADNKSELDYWEPFAHVIIENLELRSKFNYNSKQLAKHLGIKLKELSNFESMEVIPTYDFLTKLSNVYNHKLGITLYGDFMTIVPLNLQDKVVELAKNKGVRLEDYLDDLLTKTITSELKKQTTKKIKNNLVDVLINKPNSHSIVTKIPKNKAIIGNILVNEINYYTNEILEGEWKIITILYDVKKSKDKKI